MTELDLNILKIIEDFDAQAKKRGVELLGSASDEPLRAIQRGAFCLGYKAGTIDLGAEIRVRFGTSIDQLATVFAAACAWRNSARFPDAVAGELDDVTEQQLIAAIDAARKGQP